MPGEQVGLCLCRKALLCLSKENSKYIPLSPLVFDILTYKRKIILRDVHTQVVGNLKLCVVAGGCFDVVECVHVAIAPTLLDAEAQVATAGGFDLLQDMLGSRVRYGYAGRIELHWVLLAHVALLTLHPARIGLGMRSDERQGFLDARHQAVDVR